MEFPETANFLIFFFFSSVIVEHLTLSLPQDTQIWMTIETHFLSFPQLSNVSLSGGNPPLTCLLDVSSDRSFLPLAGGNINYA